MDTIPPKLEYKMFIMNQYMNTPLLDKVSSYKELPENVEDYFVLDMEKNIEYFNKLK